MARLLHPRLTLLGDRPGAVAVLAFAPPEPHTPLDLRHLAHDLVAADVVCAPWKEHGLLVACAHEDRDATLAHVHAQHPNLILQEVPGDSLHAMLPALIHHFVTLQLARQGWYTVMGGLCVHNEGLFHSQPTPKAGLDAVRLECHVVPSDGTLTVMAEPQVLVHHPLRLRDLMPAREMDAFLARGWMDGDGLHDRGCVALPAGHSAAISALATTPNGTGMEHGPEDMARYWGSTYGYAIGDPEAYVRVVLGRLSLTYPLNCLWRGAPVRNEHRSRERGGAIARALVEALSRIRLLSGCPLLDFGEEEVEETVATIDVAPTAVPRTDQRRRGPLKTIAFEPYHHHHHRKQRGAAASESRPQPPSIPIARNGGKQGAPAALEPPVKKRARKHGTATAAYRAALGTALSGGGYSRQ